MNILWCWTSILKQIIKQWQESQNLPQFTHWYKVQINFGERSEHGEINTNAAMIMAKAYQQSPLGLYEQWLPHLQNIPEVKKINFVNPGFINFVLYEKFWQNHLNLILQQGMNYGSTNQGKGEKVNLEFISANPTGPLHLAHVRGAVVGDILANIMTICGYEVDREYYINDRGGQIEALASSLYRRYGQILEQKDLIVSADEYIDSSQLYPGEYLLDIAKSLVKTDGDKHWRCDWDRDFFAKLAVSNIMENIKQDLQKLNIKFDYFTSERAICDTNLLDEAIKILQQQNLLYEGVISKPRSKKHSVDNNMPESATVNDTSDQVIDNLTGLPMMQKSPKRLLFKSTLFGDDQDRYLNKQDGAWTYFASDVAYHLHKIRRGYKRLIFILGADHSGYVKRITALTGPLSHNQVTSQVYLCQLVKIIKDAVLLKLSKRQGNIINLCDLVESLGTDATRLITISCKRAATIDIDLQKTKEQSMHNPVFYIQYAHARCYSVLQKLCDLPEIKKQILQTLPQAQNNIYQKRELSSMITDMLTVFDADLSLLQSDMELDLIRFLTQWPDIIQRALQNAEPNTIVTYLQVLSAKFHALWNQGKKCHVNKFINTNNLPLTLARINLVQGTAIVLCSGLKVLGVNAPYSM